MDLLEVRVHCSDKAKWTPKVGDSPEIVGSSDGTYTDFFLSKPNVIATTVVVYQKTATTNWSQIASVDGQGQTVWSIINDTQLHFAAPVAAGVEVGARYQYVLIADTYLQNILTRAQAEYASDDLVLKKCMYDVCGIFMIDDELLALRHEGDFIDDPTQWRNALSDLRKHLAEDLIGKIRPVINQPSVVVVGQDLRTYGPRR